MNTDDLEAVDEQAKSRISAIWILPILAAMIGAWLIYKSVVDAPVVISVFFESGEGIEVGKTEVRYEGLRIGVVKSINVQPQLIGIVASLEIDVRAELALRENTSFWLVQPEISLSGISGLSTVLSGNYITLRIGDGAPSRVFQALDSAPPKGVNEPGLHLTLRSSDLGSLSAGSPITYKRITIGDVQSYELLPNGREVSIRVFIEPEYAHVVRKNSRFWNASGISIKGGLTGFDVRTESLASLVQGGIALTELDKNSDQRRADNMDSFELYDDYTAAGAGVYVTVELPVSQGIKADITKVLYKGFEVGVVEAVEFKDDFSGMSVSVHMAPKARPYLNEKLRVWVGRPQLSLTDLSSMGSLLSGEHIEVDFDASGVESRREFVALTTPPLLKKDAPGLHLTLTVDALRSVNRGTQVLYRSVVVGSVVDYSFSPGDEAVHIQVHIEPQYAHLVNRSSRFWNAGGIEVEGGLDGIKIRTESLLSIVMGGIAFHTPDSAAAAAKKGDSFRLLKDHGSAHLEGVPITLYFADGSGLRKGTEIKFGGISVGSITAVKLNQDLDGVIAEAIISERAEEVARENTQFWVVKPSLGLVRTANLETLLSGRYITFSLGDGAAKYSFQGLARPPLIKAEKNGLNIVLTTSQLGSVKTGVQVFYRELAVGRVTGYSLADTADYVNIYVHIMDRFAPLVRSGSKFWNASGVDMAFKLFGGAKIRAESLESILEGGIGFATPDNAQMGGSVESGAQFELNSSRQDIWLTWKPSIALGQEAGN